MKEFTIEPSNYKWDYITRVPQTEALETFLATMEVGIDYAFGIGSRSHVTIFFNGQKLNAFEEYNTFWSDLECDGTPEDCGGPIVVCSDGDARCDAHADAFEFAGFRSIRRV